ncbi:MAG: SEL1-like repeat protein [Lentisphaeria bacterium]|nr:SEL1-like repeat protein [Lentisphaeria bacterium]
MKQLQENYAKSPSAQYQLGLCYEKGIGVDKNETKAIKWLVKAARQGYANAINNLTYNM